MPESGEQKHSLLVLLYTMLHGASVPRAVNDAAGLPTEVLAPSSGRLSV